jgi:hypothetical protein
MDDRRPDELLHQAADIARREELRLGWTDELTSKRCSGVGRAAWKNAALLNANEGAARGEFTTRARKRSPVVPAVANNLVLVEVDLDVPADAYPPLEEVKRRVAELMLRLGVRFPPTLIHRSRRGVCFYFRPPAGRPPAKVQLAEKGDAVDWADDGYVVGVPGLHETYETLGVVYAYIRDGEIAELPLDVYMRLAELGDEARAMWRRAFRDGEPIPEGNRRHVVFGFALDRVRDGIARKEILAELIERNSAQLQPPLERRQLEEQLDGAAKYARKHPGESEKARERARRVLNGEEEPAPPREPAKRRAPTRPLGWDWLAAFATKPVVFLDPPFWQAAAFHLKVGRKGVGKGTSLADLAARFTRGEMGPKRCVVWIGSEDSVSIDVKPRVLAAGGDPARIAVVKDWLQLPRDVPRLDATVEEVGDVGLLVIDPVSNHIAGTNSNDETDVREAIAHLNALADRFALVAVGVRHLTEKEAKSGLLAAILGSSAWVQVPRAVIALARDPHDDAVVHMQVVAGNRMPPGTPGRRFRIEAATVETDEGPSEVSRVVWDGESSVDVEELLEIRRSEPSRSEDARELILATLSAAPGRCMDAEEFDALIAERAGVSAKTVRNLRSELGVNGRGWLKAIPVKDDSGKVVRWEVGLTAGAPNPDPGLRDLPDPGLYTSEPGSGLFKPKTGGFDHPDPDSGSIGRDRVQDPGLDEPPESLPCPLHGGEHEVVKRAAGGVYLACGCRLVEEDA